ncbi:hypothetical protein JOE11_005284 [Robbsia andropogonis]
MVMWNTLLQITAEYRTTAGSLDRRMLLQKLRGQFDLREAPNYQEDWSRLRSLSVLNMAQVRNTIGEEVRLPRTDIVAALPDMLREHGGAVLLGASGAGKSAAAKAFAEALDADGQQILWFGAASFDHSDFAAFQATLQLAHTLRELLGSTSSQKPLIVLDGLDRLFEPTGFSIVASLIRLALTEDGLAPWKVLLTCQTRDWARLHSDLLTAGVPLKGWPDLEVKTLSSHDLAPVWKEIPGTMRLKLQKKLQPLWGNLKILDLLATRIGDGNDVETTGWVGETHVAAWFWQSYVRTGKAAHVKERFAMILAEKEAGELRSTFPIDSFGVGELGPYEGLRENGVCLSTSDSRIRFAHDLFGDWARLHILTAHADEFLHFIEKRIVSPLWHRAIRLYGVFLLENRKDVQGWRALRNSLIESGNASAADLLLEAVIFSANPAGQLSTLRNDLFEGDGDSFRRLLRRFLAFSTVPDARYGLDGAPPSPRLSARFRSPNWLDWPPILQFLFENRLEAIARAPGEVAKVAALWFEHTPEQIVLQRYV